MEFDTEDQVLLRIILDLSSGGNFLSYPFYFVEKMYEL